MRGFSILVSGMVLFGLAVCEQVLTKPPARLHLNGTYSSNPPLEPQVKLDDRADPMRCLQPRKRI